MLFLHVTPCVTCGEADSSYMSGSTCYKHVSVTQYSIYSTFLISGGANLFAYTEYMFKYVLHVCRENEPTNRR